MEKNTNYQKLKEFIKKIISEDYFDDDDDLGSFSGEFDPLEFKGAAMKAAKKDIGKEFEPLGKSRFEKKLNTDEFTKDLQRQNLNLSKDKKELSKIKGALDKRYKHEKQFGVGSMNEIDAVNTSEKEYENVLADKMFTDLSQEFYVPEKDQEHISNIAISRMAKDGLIDYDTEGDHDDNGHVRKGSIYSFYWLNDKGVAKIKSPQDIIDNYFYSSGPDAYEKAEKSHFSGSEGGGGMDENLDGVDSNPYMKLSPQQAEHLKRINSTTLQSIIKHLNFLKVNPNTVGQQYKLSDWWDKLGYDEKHNRWYPVSVKQDISNLASLPINMNEDKPGAYKIERTKDFEGNQIALKSRVEDTTTGMAGRVIRFGVDDSGKQTVHVEWIPKAGGQVPSLITYPNKIVVRDNAKKIKEGESNGHFKNYTDNLNLLLDLSGKLDMRDYIDFAYIGRAAKSETISVAKQILKISSQILSGLESLNQQNYKEYSNVINSLNYFKNISRWNAMVNEKPHEKWNDNKSVIDMFKNYLLNLTQTPIESELEESSIRSHANGRGQNLKPKTFPGTLKRDALKENLNQATAIDNDVFLVIDSAFNRAHYKALIGQTFKDAPSYAQVKVVNLQDVKKEKAVKYDMDEDYDYAAEEREHSGREELIDIEQAQQYVPESLQQFLAQNSFKISQTDGDGRVEYSYMLNIPKQADEQLKDIEKFIREEEPSTYTGPGQSYQKVNLYTELEKGTNNWVTKVNVVRGYDV